MPRLHRQAILFTFWLAGLATISYYVPCGPRDGWQPLAHERIWAILDDCTVVTAVRAPEDSDTNAKGIGPIRLRDVETGDILATHLGPEDRFEQIQLEGQRLGLVQQAPGPKGEISNWFRLRLIDVQTGEQKGEFSCCVPKANVWWKTTKDGKVTAYVTKDHDNPRVEWRDVSTGRLLHTIEGFQEPICFSPGGDCFVATKAAPTERVGQTHLAFWEVPSGQLKYELKPDPSTLISHFGRFSPDGTLFTEGLNVRATATGIICFTTSRLHSKLFSADGKWLVGVLHGTSETKVVTYDVIRGTPAPERTVTLPDCPIGAVYVNWLSAGGERVAVAGSTKETTPFKHAQLLSRFPLLSGLAKPRLIREGIVMDLAAQTEIARIPGWSGGPVCGERLYFTANEEGGTTIWNLPPSRPLRWLLPAWLLWSLPLGTYAAWRRRKRRAITREALASDAGAANPS